MKSDFLIRVRVFTSLLPGMQPALELATILHLDCEVLALAFSSLVQAHKFVLLECYHCALLDKAKSQNAVFVAIASSIYSLTWFMRKVSCSHTH